MQKQQLHGGGNLSPATNGLSKIIRSTEDRWIHPSKGVPKPVANNDEALLVITRATDPFFLERLISES